MEDDKVEFKVEVEEDDAEVKWFKDGVEIVPDGKRIVIVKEVIFPENFEIWVEIGLYWLVHQWCLKFFFTIILKIKNLQGTLAK